MIDQAVVAAVTERAGRHCELGGLPLRGKADLHHRKPRSQGGQNSLDNLVLACHECHMSAHANPARSYAHGHLVHRGDDPKQVRVLVILGLCGSRF